LVLGLDIQGGSHLVMGVDVQSVVQERAARMVKNLEDEFRENGIQVQGVAVVGETKTDMEVKTGSAAVKDQVLKLMTDRYPSTLQVVVANDAAVTLRYFDAVMIEMKKQVLNESIEVIRNRIDEFGVSEPSIVAQGEERILVQLPGIQDAARAKELINRTAKLDFRVVSAEMTSEKLEQLITEAETKGQYKLGEKDLGYAAYVKRLNEELAAQLPKNTKVVFEKLDGAATLEAGKRAYLVNTDTNLTGKDLEDAAVRPDEFGKPEVTFSFTLDGRKLFADLTGRAAGGQIAIVLDDVIKSAPSVKERIDSDSARITLGSMRDYNATLNEATFIATALRAGALPAALQQLEERTVGPSLGGDSVKKAQTATLVACALVFLFMLVYYRTAGIIADVTLVLNVFLTFAALTSLNATLTLPGIAGIALTVGMAVDANVLIYERMKEELRKGTSITAALRDGFSGAFSSIFDSNLTTILTCLVLMYYGTGPIRGFAVSLTIGLIVSMFTAVFVSRALFDLMVVKLGWTFMMPPAPAKEGQV
jgi:preprotein translocase subunit SecD